MSLKKSHRISHDNGFIQPCAAKYKSGRNAEAIGIVQLMKVVYKVVYGIFLTYKVIIIDVPTLFIFPTKTADNGNRTRLPSLGSWCSTNELYPHERIIL